MEETFKNFLFKFTDICYYVKYLLNLRNLEEKYQPMFFKHPPQKAMHILFTSDVLLIYLIRNFLFI